MSSSFSMVPLLGLALASFWSAAALKTWHANAIDGVELVAFLGWLTILGGYAGLIVETTRLGLLQTEAFYAVWPGLWVPMIPILATLALAASLPPLRRALVIIVHQVGDRAFVLLHALRIAAIGGVAKGFLGVIPLSFVLPVGVADLVFGLSALAMGLRWPLGGYAPRTLLFWNLAGIALILPAPALMQMGLPGPIYVFDTPPDARALFEMPMALAPMLIVPCFLICNAVHALSLLLRTRERHGDGAQSTLLVTRRLV